jgi:hypothetical protein
MNQAEGHGEKRSRKQEQFIAALLSHSTVDAAAKSVGIGDVTAWKWRKDPAFAERYRQATREVMRHTSARLQEATRVALDCLREITENKEEPASSRVSAARTILDMAVKAADLEDVQRRLDALEQAAKERKTQ